MVQLKPVVRISNRVLGDDVLNSPIYLSRLENLRFTTQIPGGFGMCSFEIPMRLLDAMQWLEADYFGCDVAVFYGAEVAWEGLLWDFSVDLVTERHEVVALGYWATLAKRVHLSFTKSVTDLDTEIENVLTSEGAWLSSDYSEVRAPAGRSVSVTYDGDETVQEILLRLLEGGDGGSPVTLYDVAVWNDRKVWVYERPTTVEWYVRRRGLQSGHIRGTLGGLWNKVAVRYANEWASGIDGGETPNWSEDATSQARYGVMSTVIQTSGVLASDAANIRADYLARHKDMPKRSELVMSERRALFQPSGASPAGLWQVRAGVNLALVDVPTTASAWDTVPDRLHSFYVIETQYDADSNTLTITPDTEADLLTRQMAAAMVKLGGDVL